MKNPANTGDFSTNRTRGVVLSGMTETTKRALNADLIDLSVPWAKRIDRTHLASRPVEEHALRASRFGAEGGAGRETTNSASEIEAACTGRKPPLRVWWLWVAFAALAMSGIFMFGLIEGLLLVIPSAVVGFLLAEFWIVLARLSKLWLIDTAF